MDYPHPLARLNAAGEIDLSNAYDDKIGDWDKVAITWGYKDFAVVTNESAALNKILTDAIKKGLQFISDRDARAAGGLHPYAHLWDNGINPVTELNEVIKVRNKALAQFGEKNIRPGMPMAMLEDVLVPVYLYHRYQLEAVTKWIGGLNYTYALRGDGQIITKPLTKEEQLKALNAVTVCLAPEFLLLPETIVKLIPPRPSGYGFTRELFKKRTGLAFDALSPAETAADFTLSFLFNTERINRMVEYEAANSGMGLNEMITVLLNKTWKAAARTGMEKLIQQQTQQILLTYLLAVSIDDNASFAVKAVVQKSLSDLKKYIIAQQKIIKEETQLANFILALQRMGTPEKAKPTIHAVMPPGAPIGCDWD